jgi:hypothetical protein
MINYHITIIMALLLCTATAQADWTTLRGNTQRSGFIEAEINQPFHVAWVRHFTGERLGTAMEPIVADDKLFVATHNGGIHALDAQTGQHLWSFQAYGAFLHSPAFADNTVITVSTDGYLYALDATNGKQKWSFFVGHGGSSASPTIAENSIFIGTRKGDFVAVDIASGDLKWKKSFEIPIRQTASYFRNKVYFTGEDLRVRCLDATTGEAVWTSEPLVGQTARDYYPVVVELNGRAFVIVRTNPIINMAKLISQDRHYICEFMGVDDSSWQKLEEWTKSSEAMGITSLWLDEQDAIVNDLEEHIEVRTFFVMDAETGKQTEFAPILWCAGCQGCGSPPVLMPDGRLLVFYRSVYGNWNMGVAPLVSLGLLDLNTMEINHLAHKHGIQPPWNTFWGTADESQNFVVAGNTLLIVHQDTLSGFDMKSKELFPIAGNRDSWGGFHNLPWARNEWHGPARGGVAVVGNRIYWMTGSRIICVVSGEQGQNAEDVEINAEKIETGTKTPLLPDVKQMLADAVKEFLSEKWAPFMMEPGLADRDFAFDDSGDVFESLSYAFPYLPKELQERVKEFLASEWGSHPPYTIKSSYNLNEGSRREYFTTLPAPLTKPDIENSHPFGNIYSVKLYAEKCNEWSRVLSSWQDLRACFDDFIKTGWKLTPENGDLNVNRYLSSLIAFADIADKAGDADAVRQAKAITEQTADALALWWKNSSENMTLPVFKDVSEWDSFIGKGDTLFFRITPHRSKIALFHEMTPEVAHLIRSRIQNEIDSIWKAFETLCPTWYLSGEERQVHYGENFIDLPDFNIDAFKAMAWLLNVKSSDEFIEYLDIPLCRADLSYIMKLSIIINQTNSQ